LSGIQGTNVVVTGGAGFIGANLAEGLSEESEVTVIDNLSTGAMGNISALVNSGRIRFVEADISDADLLRNELKGKRYVFHEAAIPSVPRSVRDPLRTNGAGITGFLSSPETLHLVIGVMSVPHRAYDDFAALHLVYDAPVLNPKAMETVQLV